MTSCCISASFSFGWSLASGVRDKGKSWWHAAASIDFRLGIWPITTDTSSTGSDPLCDGRAAFSIWTDANKAWHINCLELLPVHLPLKALHLELQNHHVLFCKDNTELWGGFAIRSPRRKETTFTDRNDDFQEIGGGSVCLRREHPLPNFLFNVACRSGSGCSDAQMAEDTRKCFSPGEDFASGHLRNGHSRPSCW